MTKRSWSVTPTDALDAEEPGRIAGIVEKMPTLMRQVVTLRKTYGYTQAEIASRLKISLEQVEDEIAAAVNFCSNKLEREELQ